MEPRFWQYRLLAISTEPIWLKFWLYTWFGSKPYIGFFFNNRTLFTILSRLGVRRAELLSGARNSEKPPRLTKFSPLWPGGGDAGKLLRPCPVFYGYFVTSQVIGGDQGIPGLALR